MPGLSRTTMLAAALSTVIAATTALANDGRGDSDYPVVGGGQDQTNLPPGQLNNGRDCSNGARCVPRGGGTPTANRDRILQDILTQIPGGDHDAPIDQDGYGGGIGNPTLMILLQQILRNSN